jgi:hypothetical protein
MRCEFCGHSNGGVVFVDWDQRHHPICWLCQIGNQGAMQLAASCLNRHPSDLPPRCLYRPFLHHRRAGRIHVSGRIRAHDPIAGPTL